ncbi:MAG: formimidoylglutamate deiminase [Deltaproteobacteria bacterium]
MQLSFEHVLTEEGWRDDVTLHIDDTTGFIDAITPAEGPCTPGFVVPGLPNLHSHAFQRALAGRTEHLDPGREDSFWTWRTEMYRLALTITPEDLEAIAAQLYVEMLEKGMTCVGEFHYLHHAPDGPYEQRDEMSARIFGAAEATGIALTHLPVLYMAGGFDRPPEDHQRRFVHADVDAFLALVESASRHLGPTSRMGVAPHSLRAVPPAALTEVVRHDGPVHIHIAEQSKEVEDCIEHLGDRPVEWLIDHVDVTRRFCLVHATHVNDDEVVVLAKSGAVAGLCPTTEANLGDGIFPAHAYVKEGGTFGVGSDSHVTVSASEELRLLEYGQRLVLQRRNLTVDGRRHVGTALWARAVAGGAQALAQPAGAIAVGRRADLVRLDADHPRLVGHGAETSLDAWIFGSAEPVADVWVAGKRLVEDGRHVARESIAAKFAEVMRRG